MKPTSGTENEPSAQPFMEEVEGLGAPRRVRAFADQSDFERTLRAYLSHPKSGLEKAKRELPKAVKAKNYRQAAVYQTMALECRSEIEKWEYLLELYDAEFNANAH